MCLHFFHGEGYPAEFIVNLMRVNERLQQSVITVVASADDICAACPSRVEETCRAELSGEPITRLDETALELLSLRVGDTVRFDHVRERLPGLIAEWRKRACDGCGWEDACAPSLEMLSHYVDKDEGPGVLDPDE